MPDIMIPAIADDGSAYRVEKLEAHRLGVRHLAVSIFVFHEDRMLLQKRALTKYHSGGLWTNTVCTHPNWGEEIIDCAHRRLQEEMGISLLLTDVGQIDYKTSVGSQLVENERVTLFEGRVLGSVYPFYPDPEEVMDYCWKTVSEVSDWIAAKPNEFTPWMRIYRRKRDFLFQS